MSSTSPRPCEIRRERQKEEVVQAIRDSDYSDVGSRGIADAVDLPHGRVRKLVQELREEDRIEVTRTVGPAKLYRVPEVED